MQENSINTVSQKIVRTFALKIRALLIISIVILIISGIWTGSYVAAIFIAYIAISSMLLLINSQMKKIQSILDVTCDPQLFVAVYRLLAKHFLFRVRKAFTSICIAHGLIMSGEFEEAAALLLKTNIKKCSSYLTVYYYLTYANCSASLGRYMDVESARTAIAAVMQAVKSTSNAGKMGSIALIMIDAILAEYRKDYAAAFSLYEQYAAIAKAPVQKVCHTSAIANLYFLMGDYAQAKQCYEHVVQNGNKLFHVSIAKEQLLQCDKKLLEQSPLDLGTENPTPFSLT